jgi:sterol desaturase/sphingolipid hydroxylase (fatty acid hydroxylase superfamily)
LSFIGFLMIFIGIGACVVVGISLIFKPFRYEKGRFLASLIADLVGSLVSVGVPIGVALLGLLLLYLSD